MPPVLRGALFYPVFYLSMAIAGLIGLLPAAVSSRAALAVANLWLRFAFLALRVIGGVRREVRGAVPEGRVVVAAKHQSMLDVFMLHAALPHARFVMKRELTRTPVFGFYALRMGAVPVDRGGGSAAMREMVARMTDGRGSQLVIYPQGTRVAPGHHKPYKIGVHALYDATGLACVPVATNSGLLWPKGLAIHPGVAVVSFLDPIPPGMPREPFMAALESEIEAETARLVEETGRARGGAA
jgi:1-acyl-sn-glycerol-3-phosphate acyltransferase